MIISKFDIEKIIKAYEEKHENYSEIVCMEECSELIQAISKSIRYKHSKEYEENMVEEIADVYICAEILKSINRITDEEIQTMVDKKMKRNLGRI